MKTWIITLFAALAASSEGQAQSLDLDWMAGHWRSSGSGPIVEESWSTGEGGLMLGFNRTVRDGRAIAFEYMRIETAADGTRYCAQPGGGAPTCFSRVSQDWQEVRFENPDHDFPQVIEYWRSGDVLTARIADLSGETDMIFLWHRIED
ncbi:DUF6265 family protein [Maricaulis parjimensis]|uniref:DUF6265 family protein n=1 Tax=Maricaulis parjimensis TaxID=144023 RepID=UPI00193A30F3|nr:DUF6265 family protein [Maricaulis parjimensis]